MTDDPTRGPSGRPEPSALAPPPNVAHLRLPGVTPLEAHAVALERLLEAMCLAATINRDAAAAFAIVFKTVAATAPYGDHGPAVAKLLATLYRRLEAHLATVPNHPPPSVA